MAVTYTLNYGLPKPDPDANIDDEFFRLQTQTLDLIDAAIKAADDLAVGKADATHGHAITDVDGLADILEGKMSANRTFALDDLTDVTGAGSAADGYLLAKSPTGWVPRSAAAALGVHQHSMSEVVGLADALDGKVSTAAFDAWSQQVDEAIATSVPAGAVMPFFRSTAPTGWLKANGAAIFRLDYADLDAAIYVGDANNATAESGYRCSNPSDPSGSRAIAGDYLVLPDLRGEAIRGVDDGRGVDTGRELGSWQGDEIKSHLHSVDPPSTNTSSDTHNHTFTTTNLSGEGANIERAGSDAYDGTKTTSSDTHSHTVNIPSFNSGFTGGSETRMRNVALLYCIKY